MSEVKDKAIKLINPMNMVTLFLGVTSVTLGVLSLLDRQKDEEDATAKSFMDINS